MLHFGLFLFVLLPPEPSADLNRMGAAAQAAGDLSAAEAAFRKASARCVFHAECLVARNNLAAGLSQRGRPEEAKAQIVSVRDSLRADDDREFRASVLSNLATVERDLGNFIEARSLYDQVMVVRTELFGPTDRRSLVTLDALAILAYESGQYERGESLARQELAIVGEVETLDSARARMALAVNLRSRGDLETAARLLEQTIAIRQKLMNNRQTMVAEAWNALGLTYRQQGRKTEAEHSYRQALSIF